VRYIGVLMPFEYYSGMQGSERAAIVLEIRNLVVSGVTVKHGVGGLQARFRRRFVPTASSTTYHAQMNN
jgi:hypothetical protein